MKLSKENIIVISCVFAAFFMGVGAMFLLDAYNCNTDQDTLETCIEQHNRLLEIVQTKEYCSKHTPVIPEDASKLNITLGAK